MVTHVKSHVNSIIWIFALQVLVDEESDGLGRLKVAREGEFSDSRDEDDGGSTSGERRVWTML